MTPVERRSTKYAEVKRVLFYTLWGNVLVAGLKLVVGFTSQSLAMVADGYHSLLDSSSNIVGFVAIHFADKPPDADHQYGHRKYETVSAMAISFGLFAAAWHIGSDAVARLLHPVTPNIGVLNFAVMIGTIAVNILVSTYERRRGEALKSELLISDAQHTNSDIYASLTVLLSLIASRLGYPLIDTLASLVIAAIVLRVGYGIVSHGLGIISDMVVIDPMRIEQVLKGMKGVQGCSAIRTRGPEDAIYMDLTILVAPTTPLNVAHELADDVEGRLREAFPGVVDIVVHMEPAPHA